MATYNLTRSAEWYDGSTVAKDQDGVLLVDSDLNERPLTGGSHLWRGDITSPPAVRELHKGTEWDDGTTVGTDIDGRLAIEPGESYSERLGSLQSKVTVFLAGDPVQGSAVVAGSLGKTMPVSGSAQGSSSVTGVLKKTASLAGSSTGQASVSGAVQRIRSVGASSSILISASAGASLAVTGVLPSVSRSFSERLEEMRPLEGCQIGIAGDASVDNKVRLLGPANLERLPSYSGPDYSLAGPADLSASPPQLGFKKGDKILLIGPSGGEPNDRKEYTFSDPSNWSVMEAMVTPDTTEYLFVVRRRVP